MMKKLSPNRKKKNKFSWGTVAVIGSWSNPRTLLVDFDFIVPLPGMIPILARLRVIGIHAVWISYTRSRHGWHLEVRINAKLTPAEQVAAQMALGSDIRRETMNLRRAINLRLNPSRFWSKRFNILYEKKL
jgi:hypothetical protein